MRSWFLRSGCWEKPRPYVEKGDDSDRATTVNSCLYWAKKKLTLADTEVFKNNPVVIKSLELAAQPVDVSLAQQWLDRADEFAKKHPEDPLLLAIRYFEVGDRFRDSDAGHKAIDLSIKALQRVGEKLKLGEYKPGKTDGKAFIQSEPPGASILLLVDGVAKDTKKKTPALVLLPTGRQTISLILEGMNPATAEIEIKDDVSKPNSIKLEPKTVKMELPFEAGWNVFIDGKIAREKSKRIETPATINVPLGVHEITVAKKGFQDIAQKITAKDGAGIDINVKPTPGTSVLLANVDIIPEMSSVEAFVVSEGLEVRNDGKLLSQGMGYQAPMKFSVTFKTNSQVRFYCGVGSVILGWELNPTELRFADPMNGELISAKRKGSVTTNKWNTFTWTISKDKTVVSLNDQAIFEKKANYEEFSGTVGVGPSHGSTIIVKSFVVSPMTK